MERAWKGEAQGDLRLPESSITRTLDPVMPRQVASGTTGGWA